MGAPASQTPETQILPQAPTYPDLQDLWGWAQDITRTLQQNLGTIARKANDTSTYPLTKDLAASGFSITGLLNITMTGFINETNSAGQTIGVNGGPVNGSAGLLINTLGPSPSTGQAAFIAFNRSGSFAANFGIDTDNTLKVGGWSMGANAYRIMHEGLSSATFTGSYGFSINPTTGPALNTAGNAQSIASGAEVALSNHSGLLVVNDPASGQTALFICAGSVVVLVAQTGTEFAATSTPTASQIGVYYSAPTYRVKNGFATAKTVSMMWLAVRNSV